MSFTAAKVGRAGRAPRVLLVNLDVSWPRGAVPCVPIGIGYMHAALRSKGIDSSVLDLALPVPRGLLRLGKKATGERLLYSMFVRGRLRERLAETVRREQPDLVGLSLRNVDGMVKRRWMPGEEIPPFLRELKTSVEIVRQASSRTPLVVLGGAGYSIAPHAILQYADADFGVQGPGEAALLNLISQITAGTAVRRQVYRAPFGFSGADYNLADPYGVDYRGYAAIGASANVQTKRGCAERCIYCSYLAIEGNRVGLRAPEIVLDEIGRMLDFGFSRLFFVDSVFSNPPEHAKAILRGMLARGYAPGRLEHWSAFVHPRGIDKELVELMRETKVNGVPDVPHSGPAGSTVPLFVDSGSDRMLQQLRKGFQTEDVLRVVELIRGTGLEVDLHFLLGGPGETAATVRETLALVRRIRPSTASFNLGVRVHPNSGLARDRGIGEEGVFSATFLPHDRRQLAGMVRSFIEEGRDCNHLVVG
jgi:hypothetical protein